jgi:hypothetical protein
MQTQFALQTLTQIVLLASKDLSGREITEGDEKSTLGEFLFQLGHKVNSKRFDSARSALSLIKRDPTSFAALISSQYRYKDQIRKLLIEEDQAS